MSKDKQREMVMPGGKWKVVEISPAKHNIKTRKRVPDLLVDMVINKEILHTSTVCPNTNNFLQEALADNSVDIVVDLVVRGTDTLPPWFESRLAYDMDGHTFHLDQEKRDTEAHRLEIQKEKEGLQKAKQVAVQRVVLEATIAKLNRVAETLFEKSCKP